jgi:peptide/nickel transport system substrate-binding protein
MNRNRYLATVAVAATAALTLAACGSDSSSSTKAGGGSDNGAVLPNSAFAKASYDDIKQGGEIVQSVSQLPANWNQLQALDGLGDTLTIEAPLNNQTGTMSTPDGQWQPDPNYIESAKLVSKSPQKIEVKLNPKAVWSDGKPITATDAINNWKAFNGTNPKFEILSDAGWRDVASVVQGSSEYEYTITYKKVNADWPNSMYPSLPSSVTTDPTVFNTGYVKKMFPGNGPFVVSKIDANAGVVTEVPNPLWWGKKPKLDRLIFRVVNQDSLGQAFANKEINVLDTQANPDVLAQASKRSDAEIQKSGGLEWTHLTFNGSKAPLTDVHVRRAIGMAIDRKTMVSVIQKQLNVKPSTQGSVIFVPGQDGYKASDGMYEKDGKPLALTITVPSDTPTNAQRAQLIQGFLKKAGIKLTLDTVPSAKYFDSYVLPGNYQMTSFSWSSTGFPISTTQSLFNPVKAEQNFTGITDDRLSGLWDKANAELDPTKRLALATDIDKVIYDYVPIVTIGTTPTIWAVQKGIVNIGASQFQTPPTDYSMVGFKK